MKNVFSRAVLCVAMIAAMSVFVACSGNSDSSVTPSEVDESSSSATSSSSAKSSSSIASSSSIEESVSSSSAIKDGSEYDATAGTLTDFRDNQTYKTVTIGTQTWMAENLNYDYNEGTAKSYCYDNEASNCDKYGRLYLWSAAMDSAGVFSSAGKGCGDGETCASAGSATLVRGVCPEGWHLPSDVEWNTLFTAVGGTSTAGTKLKSTSGWYSNRNGTDSFGFAILPAGYSSIDGDFFTEGYLAYFWSSTEYDSYVAYNWYFNCNYEDVDKDYDDKNFGFSVRCLRDSN